MMRTLRHALPAFGLVALVAPAGAQQQQAGAAASCTIDQNKPGSLTKAMFTIQQVQSATDADARNKTLRGAANSIWTDANAVKQNPTGTALTLGQLYAIMSQDVRMTVGGAATRDALGMTGTATESVDILKMVDSTLTIVEKVSPACAQTAAQLREFAWLNTMNAGLQAANAQKADSAQLYASRALVVYKGSALPHYVLSLAAQQKNDLAAANTHWAHIAELTASDTSAQAKELRAFALANRAQSAASKVDGLQGDAQKQAAAQAATEIRAFLTAFPSHPDATRMQAALASVLSKSGDKAALAGVYADQLANPAKYDDLALTNAGVIASQAGSAADAAKLFDAALQKNPWQRDALNNLAATHMNLKNWQAMLAPAQRLIEVDAGNPDSYLLLAVAYQGLMNAEKAPARKKALTDSLLKYNDRSQNLPYKVTYTEFTRGQAATSVAFTVEQLAAQQAAARPAARAGAKPAAAAKPAPARGGAPKSYTMKVDFLNEQGAVVDTQTATVGPVGPGESKPVRVESKAQGIKAVKYSVTAG